MKQGRISPLGPEMVFWLGELHSRRLGKPYREWFVCGQKPHPDAGSVTP